MGYEVHLTPFSPGTGNAPGGYDIARVLAEDNQTEVRLDGAIIGTLSAGGYIDVRLNQAGVLTTSHPAMVAQYRRSSQLKSDAQATTRIGDPMMIIIPPQKQYLTSYICTNAQVNRPTASGPIAYLNQYMTIIAPTAFLDKTMLDGRVVNVSQFKAIGQTCYSYAIISVSDGVHRVTCPLPACVYLYGYGTADSYGYMGGMKFDTDPEPLLDVQGDTAFCIGGTAQCRASGGIAYAWSGDATLNCPDCATPTVTPTVSTTYRVSITDTYGCLHYDSVRVIVNPLPVAKASADTAVCAGDGIAIHASGGARYKWFPSEGLKL